MDKMILMIGGKKRSGKDFVSSIITKNYNFTNVALALKLKLNACFIAGKTYQQMEDMKNNGESFTITWDGFKDRLFESIRRTYEQDIKLQFPDLITKDELEFNINSTPIEITCTRDKNDYNLVTFDARVFLQEIGGFWKTIFNDYQIWAKLLVSQITEVIANEGKNIIITDFRYPYEKDLINKYFHKVTTVKIIGKNLYHKDQYDNHSSETALNDFPFDYHINNTIWNDRSLNAQIDGLINEIVVS